MSFPSDRKSCLKLILFEAKKRGMFLVLLMFTIFTGTSHTRTQMHLTLPGREKYIFSSLNLNRVNQL